MRGVNKDFYHQTVTSKQVEDYISKKGKVDLSKIFDQYLRTTQIPELDYYFAVDEKDKSLLRLHYRWKNCVDGFNMPLRIKLGEEWVVIKPSDKHEGSYLTKFKVGSTISSIVNRNYYITWKESRKLVH